MRRVVIFSAEYPVLSETFVWREVQSLKENGVDVKVATLRTASKSAQGIASANWILFEKGVAKVVFNSAKTLITNPVRACKTLWFAIKNAWNCDETLKNKLKILFQGYSALGLAKALEEFEPEWLHCHFAHAPATYTMFVARFLNLKWSFTGHANDLFQRKTLLKEKLENAAKVACISEWHRTFYLNIVPSAERKLKVIRCGVALNENCTGTSSSNFSIISVGRLIEKKGFHILLEACQKLGNIQEKVIVNIIGEGPEKYKLEQLVKSMPPNIDVVFHGAKPHYEILDLLLRADLFVMPCIDDKNGDRDGIPVSMMEAMAAGVPVLSGDLPAIRELIEDGVTGWIRPATAREIETALLQIIHDKPATKKIGKSAKGWVSQEFSTSVNTKRLINMISGDIQ